ncbi:hypothetical protein [Peribacillus loiseleuriae]|uniref:hypothetical protein n=1 Tax=Peribacillus loiseleuriae TaxID=1679170 RepID=UPI003D061AA6
MNTIQLSIEELIFSFYSEGLYEQGISIKEAYFPAMNDSELKLMLEIASRSLLAKDMVEEVSNQYKLKEKYTSFIHILNDAESTVKTSKFDVRLQAEDSISFHFKNGEVYLHKLLHDHQVHYLSKLSKENMFSMVSEFFAFNPLQVESEVLFTLKSEEFDELLEDVSQMDTLSEKTIQKWVNKSENPNMVELLNDLSKRNGKMDSILSLKYDANNNPEFIDLSFIIPGKMEFWVVTRNQYLDLSFQRANESTINNLLLNNKTFLA